jgi:hypothetical protein
LPPGRTSRLPCERERVTVETNGREGEYRFTVQIPDGSGQSISGDNEAVLQRAAEEIARSRARQTVWPKDNRAAMSTLGRMFPSLRDAHGVDPWDVDMLVRWLNTAAYGKAERCAGLFLLSVWNADDWCAYGLKVRRPEHKEDRRIGRFDFNDAWACWDEHNRAAALAWLSCPFWP